MQRITRLHYYISSGIIFILLCVVCTYLCCKQQPLIVTFDKEKVVKQFVTQLSHQNLSQDRVQKVSELFAKTLKESIAEYSKEHNVIVLKKEVTFASNIDATDVIAQKIAQNMRGA